jgi:hypothetical protein
MATDDPAHPGAEASMVAVPEPFVALIIAKHDP